MLITILTVAGAVAQAYGTPSAAPAARAAPAVRAAPATPSAPLATPVGRALKDLPSTTITYYDVAGKTGPQIDKSLKKLLADPASKDAVRLVSWNIGTQITKRTEGPKCTIQNAKSTLTGKVQLPRLTEEAKVTKEVLAQWRTYVANFEGDAAASLWFISDKLRSAEQSLIGLDCAQTNTAWNAKLAELNAQVTAFAAQRAQAAQKKPAS